MDVDRLRAVRTHLTNALSFHSAALKREAVHEALALIDAELAKGDVVCRWILNPDCSMYVCCEGAGHRNRDDFCHKCGKRVEIGHE